MRQGFAARRALGAELWWSYYFALIAEASSREGRLDEGRELLTEALRMGVQTGERFYEAALYRLKGELTLQQFQVSGSTFQVTNPQSPTPYPKKPKRVFTRPLKLRGGSRQSPWSYGLRRV
jgi:hypothetical protein